MSTWRSGGSGGMLQAAVAAAAAAAVPTCRLQRPGKEHCETERQAARHGPECLRASGVATRDAV